MKLRTIASIIGFVAALAMLAASSGHASIQRTDPTVPDPRVPRQWPGGIVSLPIGREHLAYEILDYAKDLPQAQDLGGVFQSRGYVRREDLDAAGGNDSLSFAVLGWQKPGVDPNAEEPVIRVISKNYLDATDGRRVVATQAFGGVLVDSSGTLTVRGSGADAPACVVENVPVGTPGSFTWQSDKLPQGMGDVYAYRFAYRDPGVGKDMAKDAVAGVKQLLVDDWNATCAFRRGIVMVAINVGSMVGQAQVPGGGLAARGAIVAAQTAAQQWISTTWKCQ